jgi:hypothetical protein
VGSELQLVIAERAIKLWDACASVRGLKISERARTLFYAKREINKLLGVQPMPKKFPVPFDECLRFLMPKKNRSETRLKIYRDYLRDSVRVAKYMEQGHWSGKPYESTPLPDESEIEKIIIRHKSEGYTEHWFGVTKDFFTRWYSDYESKKLSERAKKGATAKWKQIKPENA